MWVLSITRNKNDASLTNKRGLFDPIELTNSNRNKKVSLHRCSTYRVELYFSRYEWKRSSNKTRHVAGGWENLCGAGCVTFTTWYRTRGFYFSWKINIAMNLIPVHQFFFYGLFPCKRETFSYWENGKIIFPWKQYEIPWILNKVYYKLKLKSWTKVRDTADISRKLAAFYLDAEKVTKWIDELGRPYLQKSHSVGRSIERSTQLLDKHVEFERVCQNTYSNVGKLLENGKSLAKQFPPYHEQIGDKCRQLSGTCTFRYSHQSD